MRAFTKEFKEAISHLPSKEKDKLILRLLKKDYVLAQRLEFELVEDTTVDERRHKMEKHVVSSSGSIAREDYSLTCLKIDMGYISGDITHHVKVTKDKFGEVSLNLLMINEVLKFAKQRILRNDSPTKKHKFCVSLFNRVFKIMILTTKLDEDLLLDLEDGFKELGGLILDNKVLLDSARENKLDINWLLDFEIPSNIAEIHKSIKGEGLLI
ncbi:MAG: hypothetical protein HRT66_02390 [Flavobacteriaceae bacterium]|nr:hypothetical protein [Flavobacteriaceae bacterium]